MAVQPSLCQELVGNPEDRCCRNMAHKAFTYDTVKFLNFRTPESFAVNYLKFRQRPNHRVFCQKDANGIANSEDPEQEQSDLGLHCLPGPIYPKT